MIELRECETDADLDAWLAVRRAVMPNERAPSLDELKQGTKPNDLLLLAVVDGDVAGSGLSKRSDVGGAFLMARVLPDRRGGGVGATLLRGLAEHAVAHGYTRASTHVAGDDEHSIAFARRFGFEETSRDIQQVLDVDGATPRDFTGVDFVSIESRPELLEAAFSLAQQGYADMPIDGIDIPLESWLAEEATLPGGSFVALANDEIVGYAGLMRWAGDAAKAENGLTVVRRDRRRRGLATALKERQIAWASANGVRTLVTYTQTGNENMQAVNARLGYVTTEVSIAFGRSLPLR
jgi:GNAT superfamily N-acetyltransferase